MMTFKTIPEKQHPLMILGCRKTESTLITKATKKSSENNSIAYFRVAWGCLFFLVKRAKRGQLFGYAFFQEMA
ncbi:MAG: hypothetical protein ACNA7G_14150 [Methylobacter sp.]